MRGAHFGEKRKRSSVKSAQTSDYQLAKVASSCRVRGLRRRQSPSICSKDRLFWVRGSADQGCGKERPQSWTECNQRIRMSKVPTTTRSRSRPGSERAGSRVQGHKVSAKKRSRPCCSGGVARQRRSPERGTGVVVRARRRKKGRRRKEEVKVQGDREQRREIGGGRRCRW